MYKTYIASYDTQQNFISNKDQFIAKLNQLKTDGISNLDIVTDFDFTLTSKSKSNIGNDSTFGVIANSPYSTTEFQTSYKELHDTYFPIERDASLSFEAKDAKMHEWWCKSLKLISDQSITEQKITDCLNHSSLSFRHDILNFVNTTERMRTPVYILSAGINAVIKGAWKEVFKSSPGKNVKIISNKCKANDKGLLLFHEPYIYTTNKCLSLNREKYPHLKKNAILLGDMIEDSLMTQKAGYKCVLKIGFLNSIDNDKSKLEDYKKAFDYVIQGNGSLSRVCQLLSIISLDSGYEGQYSKLSIIPILTEILECIKS